MREKRGLLLRQLAAYLEVDTALMSKIETGDRKPTKLQTEKIAQFLEVDRELFITLWLADRIETAIVEEPEVAYKAINLVKKNLKK